MKKLYSKLFYNDLDLIRKFIPKKIKNQVTTNRLFVNKLNEEEKNFFTNMNYP